MHTWCSRQIFDFIRVYLSRIEYGVNWHNYTHVEYICDMFIHLSEYSWNYRTNVIILSDVQVFTRRTTYINNVRYYWRKICKYGKFILYVTFLSFYLSNTPTRRKYLSIFDLTKLVKILWHTIFELNIYEVWFKLKLQIYITTSYVGVNGKEIYTQNTYI